MGLQLAIRPLSSDDAARIYEWICNAEIAANLGITRTPSLQYTLDWIERANTDPSVWARAVLVDGQHVGNVVLDHMENALGRARLSIYIGDPAARNRGVGRWTVAQALSYAFRERRLEKVYLTVHCRNVAAIRSYLACGFQIEGVHRREHRIGTNLVDTFYMGILRTEWAERQGGSTP